MTLGQTKIISDMLWTYYKGNPYETNHKVMLEYYVRETPEGGFDALVEELTAWLKHEKKTKKLPSFVPVLAP